MTFILEKDPNDLISLNTGDLIEFVKVEKEKTLNIFKGYIFNMGTDSTEAYKVTAYDQMRYLKNQDVMVVAEQNTDGTTKTDADGKAIGTTIDKLFKNICERNHVNNKVNYNNVKYRLKPKVQSNKSYFAILDEAIDEELRYGEEDGYPYFFIRDNFGTLELNEIGQFKTDYIIGDESMLTDYKYEVDIDSDTYNVIKTFSKDNKKGTTIRRIEQNNESMLRWGTLQKILDVGEMSDAQVELYAKFYLKMKNREVKTIQLEALGIDGLYAGSGFYLQLKKLGINELGMFIISATHRYDNDIHTMSLDVSGLPVEDNTVHHKEAEIIYRIVYGEFGDGEERINNLIKEGYTEEEARAIQQEVNKVYHFAWEVIDGKWEGQIIQDPEGKGNVYQYALPPQLKKDLYDLGYDVDLLDAILKSDNFERIVDDIGNVKYVRAKI